MKIKNFFKKKKSSTNAKVKSFLCGFPVNTPDILTFCGQIINVLYHTKKDEYNQKKNKPFLQLIKEKHM